MTIEDPQLLRDVMSYEQDLQKFGFETTGIQERYIFNSWDFFHIAKNRSVDRMHDASEGILGNAISKILNSLAKEKILSLDVINSRIESFRYCQMEKSNKPRRLQYVKSKKGSEKLKIRQSATEMLCLVRYLGLMIGDLVPAENEYWKLYICLRQILGCLYLPRMNICQAAELQKLIEKHNRLYLTSFGKLKPKC